MRSVRLSSKSDMYSALAAGRLGNTLPQWFDLRDWQATHATLAPWATHWGLRSGIPGGPSAMWVATEDVPTCTASLGAYNISPMAASPTLWADVWEHPGEGLCVEAVQHPPARGVWRRDKPVSQRLWRGVAARILLARFLNENSLDDVLTLLDEYPGHVVELSAFDYCLGLLPHRNYVTWEVRAY